MRSYCLGGADQVPITTPTSPRHVAGHGLVALSFVSKGLRVSTSFFSEPPHPYFMLDEDEEHPGPPREALSGLMAALPLETLVGGTSLQAAGGLIQAVEGA